MHFKERTYMSLQNRWGDNVEKEGGLLGPDGQPLSSTPEAPKEDADKAPAEPQLDFFNYINCCSL